VKPKLTENLPEALEILKDAQPEDAVFIAGSLFLVGEARRLLLK
jgi:folylpolyglutamate synthase/dihydropteroate synthase